MTRLIFKDDIDPDKIDVLLSLIKSWKIDATVKTGYSSSLQRDIKDKKLHETASGKAQPLTLSVGLWKDRDITDKQLRDKAWGTAVNCKSFVRM
jgi:hypothetical protein